MRRMVASRVVGGRAENFMSRSEHVVVIGSDESEWIVGAEANKRTFGASSQLLKVEENELLRVQAFELGNVGWAAYEEKRTYEGGLRQVIRRTLVFVLEDDSWKFVQSHFSVPVSNLERFGADVSEVLSEILESLAQEPGSLSGISGTATFVFTDIVDSTPLSLQLGEEAWHAAITAHFDSVRDAVEEQGGSVVKTLGDGGMFVFDSGSAALRAAVRIQQVVTESSDPEMTVRVGVHTGDVVQTEDDYVGATVAKAARVATAADGGQILVSTITAGMVNSSEFEFGDPITVELKGLGGSHQLQPLHWP